MGRIKMQMLDPVFATGTTKTAKATLTVAPSGLACTAELWLTKDGTTKNATSGVVAFNSTGADQQIILPIIMPSSGTYQVLLDITTDSQLIGAFYATEQVVISVPSFQISIPWAVKETGVASAFQVINFYCTVKNPTGSSLKKRCYVYWSKTYPSNYGAGAQRYWEESYPNYYLDVTLAPGESRTLLSPAKYLDEYGELLDSSPYLSIGYCVYMWMIADSVMSEIIQVCR